MSFISEEIQAQSCNEPWLTEAKLKLDTFNLTYSPIKGLQYGDSIDKIINEKKLDACETAYWIQYNRAELLGLNNRFKDALDIYYKIIPYANENNKWDLSVSSEIFIAGVMEAIGRKEDCFRHLQLAKEQIEKKQLWNLLAFYYVRKASYHRIFASKDSAFTYAHQALSLGKKYNIPRQIVDAYLLLGMVSSDIDSSIYYNQQVINQYITNKNFDGAAYMAMNVYNKVKKINDTKAAKSWLDTLTYFINKIIEYNQSYYALQSFYHKEVSNNFLAQYNYDSAYFYLKLSNEHLDKSRYNVNHTEVTQSEIDYITSTERLKNEALSKQSRFQKILLTILIIGIFSILGVAYNLYLKRKQIEQQREKILKQNEELSLSFHRQSTLLSEVHHRVKNNLQLVISLLTLHFNKVKDNKEYQYLEEISNKVRSIALIHEHLYSTGEFEKINLRSYLHELLEHYLALHMTENQFKYTIHQDQDISLNLETVMPIGIICTELISNSLKYARQPERTLVLDFNLQSLDSKYILKFHDNGISSNNISAETNKSGMGTMLIESMVRQLQAQSSPIINGTSAFNLVFQEKKVSSI